MAYVAPTSRSDGYVVPASVWNQDVVDNPIALKALIDAGGYPCQGRLSLTTGVPVTTADVTAAGTLYWVPYGGNALSLYSGTGWVRFAQAELSIAVPAVANQVYDVFLNYNSGTPALSLTAWTNDTTRATALTTQDGVLVLSGTTTKRYVGTVRTVTASQLNDSVLFRHVWNYYHRTRRYMQRQESTASWDYTTATIRQANNAAANQLDFVVGVQEVVLDVTVTGQGLNTGSASIAMGIGLDSTTAFPAGESHWVPSTNAGYYTPLGAKYVTMPAIGRHYAAWLEWSQAAGTTTFYGTNPATTPTGTVFGIQGWIEG